MTGYLLSIIGIVLFCGLLCAILPEGKLSDSVKTACKLSVLAVFAAPIAAFLMGLKTGDNLLIENSNQAVIKLDSSFIDYCCKSRVESLKKQILSTLQDVRSEIAFVEIEWEYESVQTDEAYLKSYDETKIKITKICIFITSGLGEKWQVELEEKMQKEYGCEVEFCIT